MKLLRRLLVLVVLLPAVRGPATAGAGARRLAPPAPVADLPGWKLTAVEDFNIPVSLGTWPGRLDGWRAYPYPWHDGGCNGCYGGGYGTYDPARTLSVADGVLTMNLSTDHGEHLVAAVLPPFGHGVYTRVAVNWRADKSLDGYQTAFMQWADANAAAAGEHDWPEMFLGADPNGSGYVHFKAPAPFPFAEGVPNLHLDTDRWHTTAIAWTPGQVVFELDGRVVGRVRDPHITDQPMHPVLQVQTSLADPAPPTTSGRVQIGWVATWEMT